MINRQNGFTLIELLIVVFLIGVISSVAVLSIGNVDGGRRLEVEAQRVGHLFSLATQEAILQGRPVGVILDSKGYGFLIAGQEEWGALEGEALLSDRKLPNDWKLELSSGGYNRATPSADGEDEKLVPQIIFYPSGQITPFELLIRDSAGEVDFRLKGLATGQIKLHRGGESL